MPTVTILPHTELCPQGKILENIPTGTRLCDVLLENHIDIEHACECSCACTTCHVIIRQGFDSLNPATEREEDMLDQAWGLEAQSRLSCQSILGTEDITIEIPRYSINHARE
ncbi:MAG: ISC system 2Fe-2S type ferredoxin [Neisseriaceae bacterium]|nr:ISC system 2Fe-2S type ferredoxin [Neisseriaceae bacterium]